MRFIKVTIYTSQIGLEVLEGGLYQIGINNYQVEDPADFEEFLEGKTVHWDYVDDALLNLKFNEPNIKIYLPDNNQTRDRLADIASLLKNLREQDKNGAFGRLVAEFDDVCDDDWANSWKKYFKPLKVGKKILIKPTWETVKDSAGRLILEIDPASAFGTGGHATTKLCMEEIERRVKPGDNVLDLGCGSGILSICALLLGAEKVTAVDIEENAVKIAEENLSDNGYTAASGKTRLFCGNITSDADLFAKVSDERYDLIAANIVADVIISMKDLFAKLLKNRDSTLIVSGIIETRAEEIKSALKNSGLRIKATHHKTEWVSITCGPR